MVMMILLPVDGSENSDRAVRHVVDLRDNGLSIDVMLLNVQTELPERKGARGQSRAEAAYYNKEGEKTSQSAANILARAGIPFRRYVRLGPVAQNIIGMAQENNCDAIVMGTRGMGAVPGLMLGSIAMKVVQSAEIPVTLVS